MSTQAFKDLSKAVASMQSSVAKLANEEPPISRDIASSLQGVHSTLLRIDLTLESMSKYLAVLHERIEDIAEKTASIGNTASVPTPVHPPVPDLTETNCLQNSIPPWSKDDEDWFDSLLNDPAPGYFTDMLCYETIMNSKTQYNGIPYQLTGSLGHRDLENPVGPMKHYLKHISKTPVLNGGTGTSLKRTVSSMTLDPEV